MGGVELARSLGPSAPSILGLVTLLLTHGCAGACVALVLLGSSSARRTQSWEPWLQWAARALLLVAAAAAMPLLAVFLFAFAANQPAELAWLRSAFGPWLSALIALPLMAVAAWGAALTAKSHGSIRLLELGAALAALAAIVLAALVQGALARPSEWLEQATPMLLSSPAIMGLVVWRLTLAASLGTVALLGLSRFRASQPPNPPGDRLGSWALGSWVCLALVLAIACWWVARGGATDALLAVPTASGVHGARAGRMATVALLAAVACVGLLGLHATMQWKRWSLTSALLVVGIGVMAGAFAEQARRSALLPWSAPGLVYTNRLTVERVRAYRHSAQLNAGDGRDRLGRRMFELHCAACHEPSSTQRAQLQERGLPATRAWLEQLREADQYGSPYNNLMPPLAGSDAELDALAGWLCGGP